MTVLSYAELEAYWIQAGGNKAVAPLMAAIALAESSGDTESVNPTDNNGTQTSWGLWQISDGTHNQVSPSWNDPLTNAKLAVAKYNNSQGLDNWGTYTSGAYKKYMQGGVVPQLPSGVNSTQQNGSVTQADVTSDIGGAIAGGILSGFAGALGPVLKWGMWFLETALGFAVMVGGVILVMQSSQTVRNAEKKTLTAVPAGRAATAGSAVVRNPMPAKTRPATRTVVNPYSGEKVRDAAKERQAREKRQNAAAERRVTKARVESATRKSKDPRNEYRK